MKIVFSFREKSHKEILCRSYKLNTYQACIPYSSIYLIKHTCSPKEIKKNWESWKEDKHTSKIVATVRKDTHVIPRDYKIAACSKYGTQLQIIRWNFWQKHTFTRKGGRDHADERGKKEQCSKLHILYLFIVFTVYILLNSHTHSLRTE